ncbi:hypothetical protein [Paenibacillus sp. PL91]|nr:hypothetical protein [Paenibacillus sp. PL91]MBC9203772.1 hypothetical protein [Paenibacillus sp. PL91]
MLLKALIVDDEPTHIQGLVRYIKWQELGYDDPVTANPRFAGGTPCPSS